MHGNYRIRVPKIYLNLFSILNVFGIIACFVNIKLGIVSALLILIFVITHFNLKLFLNDFGFMLYLFCNLLSIVSYMWNQRPLSVFISAISFNVIPSLLYYLGKYIAESNQDGIVIDRLLSAVVNMMLIGMVAYLIFPSFYYEYIGASIDSYTYGLGEYRYGSFISSLALGSIGTICVILYFYRFENLTFWKKIIFLPTIIINVILCMQRSAWVTTIIAICACLIHKFKNNRKLRIRLIGIFIIFSFFMAVVIFNIDKILTPTQLMYFESRLNVLKISEMTSSRSDQWIQAWNIFCSNPITGYGLGSCGQKAATLGLSIITDGNHLRILAEIGFFGFLSFVIMNIKSIINSVKKKNYYFAFVIIICNMAAIGSPIFDQYYSSFAFWLILGLASNLKSNVSKEMSEINGTK